MPSMVLGFVAGSGFVPLWSGNPYSGFLEPIGGLQIRADRNNSGNIFISLSGSFVHSGQIGVLVGSGGPTINSGGMPLSGVGMMDGLQLGPGDAYFVPKLSFPGGARSGLCPISLGCEVACSGQARVYWEAF